MRALVTVVAILAGLGLSLGAPVSAQAPVPPEEEIVRSFVAWAQSQGTPVDQPAGAVSVTSDETPMIVCYGLTGDVTTTGYDGVMVVFAVSVDGALEFRPFPLGNGAAPTSTETTAPGVTTVAVGPATTFGDGTHIVGTDIAPGTYRAEATGDLCYWARLSGFSGEGEDIISNGVTDAGQVIVEIAPTDAAFESQDCGDWTPVP